MSEPAFRLIDTDPRSPRYGLPVVPDSAGEAVTPQPDVRTFDQNPGPGVMNTWGDTIPAAGEACWKDSTPPEFQAFPDPSVYEQRQTGVMSEECWDWPETRAFLARLGVDANVRTVGISVKLLQGQLVKVFHEYLPLPPEAHPEGPTVEWAKVAEQAPKTPQEDFSFTDRILAIMRKLQNQPPDDGADKPLCVGEAPPTT